MTMRIPLRSSLPRSVVLMALATACRPGGNANTLADRLNDHLIHDLSAASVARVGDAIGQAREARFLDGGRRVVVLDRYPPYLRLFTPAGNPLWSGGAEGGGPKELDSPQAIATDGDSLVVVQQGKISGWRLSGDSLLFTGTLPIPPEYFPKGVQFGCGDRLLLYARNDRQFMVPMDSFDAVPRLDYLHTVTRDSGRYRIRALWSAERNPAAFAPMGHSQGALMGLLGDRIVLLHRSNFRSSGEVLELDCQGRVLHRYSEKAMVTGEGMPVLIPRPRALEWTSGIVALPDGFAIPLEKYSRDWDAPEKSYWQTEVLVFRDGAFRESAVIPLQWKFMDHDPDAGTLIAVNEPVPHFIILPVGTLAGPAQ